MSVALYAVAKFSGTIPDVSADEALIQGAAYVAIIATTIESIRHFVTPVAKA